MSRLVRLEWMWFAASILICALIILLIYDKMGSSYRFYYSNITSILLMLNLTRYIFLFKYTPFARVNWYKFLWIFLPIPLLMWTIDGMIEFQGFLQEEGTFALVKDADSNVSSFWSQFVRSQYIFFGIGTIVTLCLVPIRMIISFWRTTNTVDKV